MSAAVWHDGLFDWSLERDAEGYRRYTAKFLVYAGLTDGPFTAMLASGLPAVGSAWAYGGDSDPWSFCLPEMSVQRWQPRVGEVSHWWVITVFFANKPQKRCQDTQIENPLEEPPKISGSFARYQKPADSDKDGKPILSSSHEPLTGLEKEANRPQVIIELNDGSLDLATFAEMVNGLNDAALWGVAAKGIMLTDVSWDRKLYGTCFFYYTKRFTFDIRFETWVESDIGDFGFKEYGGDTYGGAKVNPKNFKRMKDQADDKTPTPVALLDGDSNPDPVDNPQYIDPVEFYNTYNFLLLGIPSSLE